MVKPINKKQMRKSLIFMIAVLVTLNMDSIAQKFSLPLIVVDDVSGEVTMDGQRVDGNDGVIIKVQHGSTLTIFRALMEHCYNPNTGCEDNCDCKSGVLCYERTDLGTAADGQEIMRSALVWPSTASDNSNLGSDVYRNEFGLWQRDNSDR